MRVSRLLTNRRLFILLASVILLIVIAGLTLRAKNRNASWPERAVMDVENVVGGWLYRPISAGTSFIQGIHDLHSMYEENAQLKSELQKYDSLQAQLNEANQQIQQQNTMLGYKHSTLGQQMTLLPAHVVGRDPSAWNSSITIDAGMNQGLRDDMAVLSVDGSLVGKVVAVADDSAKVVLITDTQVGDGVSARVQTTKGNPPFGIVVGSTTDTGQLDMNFLSPIAQLSVGQVVVTSGLSDIYPPGILIGKITKLHQGLPGLTQSAVVQPNANLDYLQNVFIVTRSSR